MLVSPTTTNDTATVSSAKHFGVSSERENLSDFVRRIVNEKDLSYRKVALRSGGKVSHATVSDIINGNVKEVKIETLEGLAAGLGVSEDEVFAVARGKSLTKSGEPEDEEMQLFFYNYKNLSRKDKEELKVSWDMLKREVARRIEARGDVITSRNKT